MKKIVKYNAKKGGVSTSTSGGILVAGGLGAGTPISEAYHAEKADFATKAGEATHAASSATLDANSDVRLDIEDLKEDLTEMSNKYLRKDQDDSTPFTLGMQNAKVLDKVTARKVIASLAQSDGFKSISDGDGAQGWALRLLDAIATGELDDLIVRRNAKVKDLTVTGAAHFFKLIIDEIKSAGGSVLLTPANGFVAENVTHHGTAGAEDERYILYWKDSDGEKTIDNQWQVGDFAVCMTANLKKGVSENAGNKTWWCKVVDAGNEGGYNYISLDWYNRAQGRTITESGKTFTEATSSGIPEKGDNVAMLGSVATDKDGNFDYKRQSAIYLAAYDSLDMGIETPFLAFYYGIDDFCLSRHRKTHLSRLATNVVADKFTVRSDDEEYPLSVFFGDWNSETTYPKAGVVNYNGCTWTSLKDGNKGNTPSSSSEWWVSNKGEKGDYIDIAFKLNGISVGVLNYNTVRDADAAMTLECDFLLNGEAYTSKSCRLGCYDARGNLLGTEITSTDATSIIAEVGNLYLSKGCKNIQCSFAIDGGEYSDSLTVVTDGVTVKNTAYKYYISSSPNDKPDWSKIASTATPPQPTMAKGNYLYVMTIVTYSDDTETSTVTISYCGTDGDSIKVTSTSVTYAVTDDAKQPADSAFTYTSVPTVEVGKYLWCKTVVNYSDGNSTKSYAVSRVGSDGDQGYSLHFAYADSVTYSGSTPTVAGFSTTRKDSSEWLGVNRSLEVEDPTDPTAYEWTKIKGADGRDVYRLEVISSAGLVYHNGSLNTVLSAHVWGPDGEVTDRCNGTFTWYDLRVSNSIGTGKTYTAQATTAVDAYHYRCIYNGEVSKETYNVVYNGKQLQYNSKNIQF